MDHNFVDLWEKGMPVCSHCFADMSCDSNATEPCPGQSSVKSVEQLEKEEYEKLLGEKQRFDYLHAKYGSRE